MKLKNYEIALSEAPKADNIFYNERIKNTVLKHFSNFFEKETILLKDERGNGFAEISFDNGKNYFPMAYYVYNESENINLTDGLFAICNEYIKNSNKKIKKKSFKAFNFKAASSDGNRKEKAFTPFIVSAPDADLYIICMPFKFFASGSAKPVYDSEIIKIIKNITLDMISASKLTAYEALIPDKLKESLQIKAEDVYNIGEFAASLCLFEEIREDEYFGDDNAFFEKQGKKIICKPTILQRMDNCFELRNVIIKALNKSGGKGFSYYSEFDKPVEMLKAVRKEISGFSENIWDNFFQNMSKAFNETLEKLKGEKLKITYDGGEDAKIIDLHELIHNEAGYTVGSAHLNDGYYISRGREGIPDNEYHIEIKGENISRIHGVIFFDESMDSLIYRRTTFHKKEETAFEKTIKTDDFEIFDGALIYIGDTLVKFEYIQ